MQRHSRCVRVGRGPNHVGAASDLEARREAANVGVLFQTVLGATVERIRGTGPASTHATRPQSTLALGEQLSRLDASPVRRLHRAVIAVVFDPGGAQRRGKERIQGHSEVHIAANQKERAGVSEMLQGSAATNELHQFQNWTDARSKEDCRRVTGSTPLAQTSGKGRRPASQSAGAETGALNNCKHADSQSADAYHCAFVRPSSSTNRSRHRKRMGRICSRRAELGKRNGVASRSR